ncbi:hypothetical protein TEA_014298 [Camellia sinensis var. sinensis]|uniref:Uncharacterized protein n=1 Tax=Camellia sinensis var. sinensis TaxID=542762 RepID=A0A4S4EC53_CAMSN|nr:hypothetical protein TEA_014298 [Camellia sinensis var. sinensis]
MNDLNPEKAVTFWDMKRHQLQLRNLLSKHQCHSRSRGFKHSQKLSHQARKTSPNNPVFFNSSFLSTTRSGNPRVMVSLPLNFTMIMVFHEKIKRKKTDMGFGFLPMRFVVGLSLIFSTEYRKEGVEDGEADVGVGVGGVEEAAEGDGVRGCPELENAVDVNEMVEEAAVLALVTMEGRLGSMDSSSPRRKGRADSRSF